MSDDTNKDAGTLPSGPETGEAAPPPDAAIDEVEYIYEDEHGNRIEAPEGGFESGEYEEVVTEVPADEADAAGQVAEQPAGQAPAPAEGADASDAATAAAVSSDETAAATANATTKRLIKPASSSRRTSDRKSGRQSKPMTPEDMKKVRRKVIFLLTLIALIPILGITLLVMLHKKGRLWNKPKVQKLVDNDFDKGRSLYMNSSFNLDKANKLYDQGKMAEAHAEYKKCEADMEAALRMIDKWRQENPGDYAQVDATAQEIRVKLFRQVKERLVITSGSGTASPSGQQP